MYSKSNTAIKTRITYCSHFLLCLLIANVFLIFTFWIPSIYVGFPAQKALKDNILAIKEVNITWSNNKFDPVLINCSTATNQLLELQKNLGQCNSLDDSFLCNGTTIEMTKMAYIYYADKSLSFTISETGFSAINNFCNKCSWIYSDYLNFILNGNGKEKACSGSPSKNSDDLSTIILFIYIFGLGFSVAISIIFYLLLVF